MSQNESQPVKQTKAAKKADYFTKPDYEVLEEEKDMVHVLTSRFTLSGNFDKNTHVTRHIVDPKTWAQVRKVWPTQGMQFVEMLHYPAGTPQGFAAPEAENDES